MTAFVAESPADSIARWQVAWQWSPAIVLVLAAVAVIVAVASMSRHGGLSGRSRTAVIARVLAIGMLVVMLSGWSVSQEGPPDAVAEPFTPSLSIRSPRIVRLGDAVGIDIDAVLEARDSVGQPLKADLVGATGDAIASAVLSEHDSPPRDGRPGRARRGTRYRGRIVWRPEVAGTLSGTVRIPGEEAAGAAPLSLRVADEPVRVFLLDRPRFESRFLSRVLSGDRRFAVTEQLQSPGSTPVGPDRSPTHAARLPADRVDWNQFDVVVIGGVDPLSIPEPVASALVEAAAHDGVGIVWSLDAASDPEAIAVSPLGRLLPFRGVSLDPPFTTSCRIELADPGDEAAWLALADDAAESQEAWGTLPTVYAAVRPAAIRPTARVMATCTPDAAAGEANHPFILVDQAGEARIVAFLAETWRLRQAARGPLVDRLLSQAMLHAAEPHFASRQPGDIARGSGTKPEDEPAIPEGSRGGMPKAALRTTSPSTSRPLWNHPAILLLLIAACGVEWWIRERSGERP